MPALSYFNIITWFAPNNVVVANLVSSIHFEVHQSNDSIVWGIIWPWNVSIDF